MKENLNILMLGKTGSGKSSTINMLANLYRDKKFKNPREIFIT